MRPKIICHMVSSVDGRILADRWTPPVEDAEPDLVLSVYEDAATQLQAEGWIVGRRTTADMATESAPAITDGIAAPRAAHVGNWRKRNLAVAIDPAGKLHYAKDSIAENHIVCVLAESVSDAYLESLRKVGVSYVFAGQAGGDLPAAMDAIGSAFGVRTLLLEGGGITNGSFLKADLIDEISLLVYPGLDGLASVSSIFEYHGVSEGELPAAGRALRLLSAKTQRSGFVWLRYEVQRNLR